MDIPENAITLTPDMDYDDCLRLCEELGLVEIVNHGGHDYGRITQKGRNCVSALIKLASHGFEPENVLKAT